ncbi:MAG: TlpA disulfide reductase family protein [Terracidiphilus sp.]
MNKVNSQPAIARPAIIRRARHRARQFPASLGFCAALFLSLAVAAIPLHAAPPRQSLVNKPAPAFVRNDLNGRRIRLRAYRGKVVLLNFWATWCGPCQVELPHFAAWQQQYGPDGLQVLAVSMDDTSAPVRALVRKMQLDFPVVMGDQKLGERYGGVLGLPITFLIGRDGQVYARIDGQTDLQAMERTIKTLLAQP